MSKKSGTPLTKILNNTWQDEQFHSFPGEDAGEGQMRGQQCPLAVSLQRPP